MPSFSLTILWPHHSKRLHHRLHARWYAYLVWDGTNVVIGFAWRVPLSGGGVVLGLVVLPL